MFKKRTALGTRKKPAADEKSDDDEVDACADTCARESEKRAKLAELREEQKFRKRGAGLSSYKLGSTEKVETAPLRVMTKTVAPEDEMTVQTLEKAMDRKYCAETGDLVADKSLHEKAMTEFIDNKLGVVKAVLEPLVELSAEDKLYVIKPLDIERVAVEETKDGSALGLMEVLLPTTLARENEQRTRDAVAKLAYDKARGAPRLSSALLPEDRESAINASPFSAARAAAANAAAPTKPTDGRVISRYLRHQRHGRR